MSKYTEGMYTKGYGLHSRSIPPFHLLLEAQPCLDRAEIARNFGVSPRTFARYIAQNDAPRAVMLAMFYESSLGREFLHTKLQNEASCFAQLAHGLQRRLDFFEGLQRLRACRDLLPANDDAFLQQLDLFSPPVLDGVR